MKVYWMAMLAAGLLHAQDYCSLKVRVITPNGERPDVLVTVIEGSRLIERYQGGSDVEFCDLGILPVMVKIGNRDDCNHVAVTNVPIEWKSPYLLVVTQDVEACPRDLPPPPTPTCRVLFRVSDLNAVWVGGAALKATRYPEQLTDKYGRASLLIAAGEEIRGAVARPGFAITSFAATCKEDSPTIELRIRLRPLR